MRMKALSSQFNYGGLTLQLNNNADVRNHLDLIQKTLWPAFCSAVAVFPDAIGVSRNTDLVTLWNLSSRIAKNDPFYVGVGEAAVNAIVPLGHDRYRLIETTEEWLEECAEMALKALNRPEIHGSRSYELIGNW